MVGVDVEILHVGGEVYYIAVGRPTLLPETRVFSIIVVASFIRWMVLLLLLC